MNKAEKQRIDPKAITFIVPMYNEENAIADTLSRLHAQLEGQGVPFEIIAVDDCSTDNSADVAKETGLARVIRHPVNSGYGHSLKTGIANAAYDRIGIVDADGTYDIESIPALISALDDGFDMAVAKRQNLSDHDRPIKGFFRKLYIRSIEILIGSKVPDPNSGLRIFTRDLVTAFLPFLCNTFSFTTSLTVFAFGGAHFVKFIPTQYEGRVGRSKVRHFRDSLRTIQLIIEGVTFYNPIKLYLLLALAQTLLVGLPSLLLYFCSPGLAILYGVVGSVPFILVGLGSLADIFRISNMRRLNTAEIYGGQPLKVSNPSDDSVDNIS